MDQKRALVAVVLIFLVLFGYNFWISRKAEEQALETGVIPAVESVAGEVAEKAGSDDTSLAESLPPGANVASGEAGAAADLVAGADAQETLISVKSELWGATLSTRGGALLSWGLAEHRGTDGEAINLVPGGSLGLDVTITHGATSVDVSEWTFEYSGPIDIVLSDGRSTTLVFEATNPAGLRVTREYVFHSDSYLFTAGVSVEGPSGPAAQRDMRIGWPGIVPTERKEEDRSLSSVAMIDGEVDRENLGKLKKESKKKTGEIAWATATSRYFMVAIAPIGATFREIEMFGDGDARTAGFEAVMDLGSGATTRTFTVYAGPQDYLGISELGLELETAVDLGWKLTRPLSVLTLRALVWAHGLIPNYGLVIILFSVLTKLIFYRLTHKSFSEMKRMQDLQPKLKALQEQYKNDKEALAKVQMELYKKEHVNPLGSCLPMLLQMPVFIALFQVLRTTIELRGAPFALWITDLSQPDTIAEIAGFPIHVLPILMGLGMLVQQRFTSKDPQQAMMGKMMPIIFTALFYNFASGLVIYWFINTVLSIVQQYYIHRDPDMATEQPIAGEHTSQPTSSSTSVPDFSGSDKTVNTPTTRGENGGFKGKGRKKR